MGELKQLKERIEKSAYNGIKTAFVRDDYAPAGDMMIAGLVDSGEFITRRVSTAFDESEWRIFSVEFKPY